MRDTPRRSAQSAIPVTVVVPVKDEARNLTRCLPLLERFAQVWVVDSHSTDGTQEIVESAGRRYIAFAWDGAFPKKRNWVLLNFEIPTDWVLFLDADEFVTDAFCEEVASRIMDPETAGCWCQYDNHFLGRRLRFGLPQRKLALFRVGAGLYEKIPENAWSSLDMEVHEHPQIKGKVGEIRSRIIHDDDRGIEKFVNRHIAYARWEAKRYEGLVLSDAWETFSLRQKVKYASLGKGWYPVAYFLYVYVIRLGVLDGRAGLLYALYKAWYFLTIGLMIKQAKQERADSSAA